MAIRQEVEDALETLRVALVTRQNDYRAQRGKFRQFLRTHQLPVDQLQPRAPEEGVSWAEGGITLPSTLPLTLEVHEYVGPQGVGYVVIATVIDGGQTWQRARNVGPEVYRTHGWQRGEVEP